MSPAVVVVGGGSVGLFLANRLHALGVRALVLEREPSPDTHSRAIGLHPPSLEYLEALGAVEPVLEGGVAVRRGIAMGDRGPLGTLSFEGLPGPYPFVLSIPQYLTEAALEARLESLAPGAVRRGLEVVEVEGGRVRWLASDGEIGEVEATWVAGCDGKDSVVRQAAGIAFPGGPYPDTFAMGDFEDDTPYGPDAVLFLHSAGLVECFPLPGGVRRWVTWTTSDDPEDPETSVRAAVAARTPHTLEGKPALMISRFRVYRHRAERLVEGPVVLAGDAAHQMSPMGGQGMNTGFMDAWTLGEALRDALAEPSTSGERLRTWERERIRSMDKAIRRAESNMRLGRGGRWSPVRDLGIRGVLRSPLAGVLARVFTMRGL